MKSQILSFYKELINIKSFDGIPSDWELVNPYRKHWDLFEFFIEKYYNDNKKRDLIIALNPGRYGCNKTGIALTDENTLFSKLEFPFDKNNSEKEGTATKIYTIIEEIYPSFNEFFSRFYMTNIFPFGVVADGKNVEFNKIMKVLSLKEFSKEFVGKSIEIFNPQRILCVGRGSEKFILKNFPNCKPIYLHHPAYTFPDEKKDEYRYYLK